MKDHTLLTVFIIGFLLIDLVIVAVWSHREGRRYERKQDDWPFDQIVK